LEKKDKWKKQEKLNQYPIKISVLSRDSPLSSIAEVVKQADRCPKKQVQCAVPEPTPRKKNKKPFAYPT
jgi:hypothetical protein